MFIEQQVKENGVTKTLALTIADKTVDGLTDVQKVLTEIIPNGTIVKTENLKMTTEELQRTITGYDISTGQVVVDSEALVAQVDPELTIETEEPITDEPQNRE